MNPDYSLAGWVSSRGTLNWRNPRTRCMTMRYCHLSDAYLKAAVNRVNLGAHASPSKVRARSTPSPTVPRKKTAVGGERV